VVEGMMKSFQDATLEVRHISVSINRSVADVYRFISDGEKLQQWATGLGTTYRRDGDDWIVQGPLGTVRARLAKPNEFGVADQMVTLETGITIHNPIRVVQNGKGSTVTFWLMRLPGVSDTQFDADAQWVQKDLATLKRLLEEG
jgi:hypothetical protein